MKKSVCNVDLSNLENILQRNLGTGSARECFFRAFFHTVPIMMVLSWVWCLYRSAPRKSRYFFTDWDHQNWIGVLINSIKFLSSDVFFICGYKSVIQVCMKYILVSCLCWYSKLTVEGSWSYRCCFVRKTSLTICTLLSI